MTALPTSPPLSRRLLHACLAAAMLLAWVPVAPGSRRWWRAFNRISAKHLDFVLCDAAWRPVLAVELDDRSHERPDRRRRDCFVEQALARAGLPLLRLRPARSWLELPQLLHEALAKSPLAEAAYLPARKPAGRWQHLSHVDGAPA